MDSHIRILVLQRGWVAVGKFSQAGEQVTLENASVIRRWGTTKGLGELLTGPTKETVLDPCGTLRVHALAVIFSLECDAEGWAKHVGG